MDYVKVGQGLGLERMIL